MSLFTRAFTGALVTHEKMSCVRIGRGRLSSLNLTRTMAVLIAAQNLPRSEQPHDAHRRSTGSTLRTERTFTLPLLLAFLASPQRTSIASSARPSPQVLPSGCVPRSCAAAPPLRIAPRRMTGVLGSHGAPRADHAPRMECAWTHRGRNCRSPVVLSGEQCGLALRVKHLPTLHGGGG